MKLSMQAGIFGNSKVGKAPGGMYKTVTTGIRCLF